MKAFALVCVSCLKELTVVVGPGEELTELPDHECETEEGSAA